MGSITIVTTDVQNQRNAFKKHDIPICGAALDRTHFSIHYDWN